MADPDAGEECGHNPEAAAVRRGIRALTGLTDAEITEVGGIPEDFATDADEASI